MFADDYVYRQIKANITEAPSFTTTVSVPVRMNWKLVYVDADETDEAESNGIGREANMFIHEGQNKKPQQPTWKWLKTFLEKYDIGTGATRTSTFSELSSGKTPYFLDKKGKITLTDEGPISAYLVQGTYIADPSITKRVFDIFQEVGRHEAGINEAQNSIQKTVENDMPIILNNAKTLVQKFGNPSKNMQPLEVKDKITGIFEPTGEEVSFNTTWGEHEFTDDEVTTLLAGQEIDVQGTGKKGPYTYRGKLSFLKYKGKSAFGFTGKFI